MYFDHFHVTVETYKSTGHSQIHIVYGEQCDKQVLTLAPSVARALAEKLQEACAEAQFRQAHHKTPTDSTEDPKYLATWTPETGVVYNLP
jgi:hypothetical protein